MQELAVHTWTFLHQQPTPPAYNRAQCSMHAAVVEQCQYCFASTLLGAVREARDGFILLPWTIRCINLLTASVHTPTFALSCVAWFVPPLILQVAFLFFFSI